MRISFHNLVPPLFSFLLLPTVAKIIKSDAVQTQAENACAGLGRNSSSSQNRTSVWMSGWYLWPCAHSTKQKPLAQEGLCSRARVRPYQSEWHLQNTSHPLPFKVTLVKSAVDWDRAQTITFAATFLYFGLT